MSLRDSEAPSPPDREGYTSGKPPDETPPASEFNRYDSLILYGNNFQAAIRGTQVEKGTVRVDETGSAIAIGACPVITTPQGRVDTARIGDAMRKGAGGIVVGVNFDPSRGMTYLDIANGTKDTETEYEVIFIDGEEARLVSRNPGGNVEAFNIPVPDEGVVLIAPKGAGARLRGLAGASTPAEFLRSGAPGLFDSLPSELAGSWALLRYGEPSRAMREAGSVRREEPLSGDRGETRYTGFTYAPEGGGTPRSSSLDPYGERVVMSIQNPDICSRLRTNPHLPVFAIMCEGKTAVDGEIMTSVSSLLDERTQQVGGLTDGMFQRDAITLIRGILQKHGNPETKLTLVAGAVGAGNKLYTLSVGNSPATFLHSLEGGWHTVTQSPHDEGFAGEIGVTRYRNLPDNQVLILADSGACDGVGGADGIREIIHTLVTDPDGSKRPEAIFPRTARAIATGGWNPARCLIIQGRAPRTSPPPPTVSEPTSTNVQTEPPTPVPQGSESLNTGPRSSEAQQLSNPLTLVADLQGALHDASDRGISLQSFQVAPEALAALLRSNSGLFPDNIKVDALDIQVQDGQLLLRGKLTTRKGITATVHLNNATFTVSPAGELQLLGIPDYNVEVTRLVRGRANTMAGEIISDVDGLLRKGLASQTPGWVVSGFDLTDEGQIEVRFVQPRGSRPPPSAGGVDVSEGPRPSVPKTMSEEDAHVVASLRGDDYTMSYLKDYFDLSDDPTDAEVLTANAAYLRANSSVYQQAPPPDAGRDVAGARSDEGAQTLDIARGTGRMFDEMAAPVGEQIALFSRAERILERELYPYENNYLTHGGHEEVLYAAKNILERPLTKKELTALDERDVQDVEGLVGFVRENLRTGIDENKSASSVFAVPSKTELIMAAEMQGLQIESDLEILGLQFEVATTRRYGPIYGFDYRNGVAPLVLLSGEGVTQQSYRDMKAEAKRIHESPPPSDGSV
jgi:hypothetical protein